MQNIKAIALGEELIYEYNRINEASEEISKNKIYKKC